MLKACKYCGRVHDTKYDCGKRPKRKRRYTIEKSSEANKFRGTQVWKRKSKVTKERDRYICQACLAKIEPYDRYVNEEELEVHHIEPIAESYERRLDSDNLITLCRTHHEMAECGKISKATLRKLVKHSTPR